MPLHPDFQKIYSHFVKKYGEEKGKSMFYAWVNKHGYDDTKAFPKKQNREHECFVRGFELREFMGEYYLEGIISSSHVYDVPDEELPEYIPKETLESFAAQINTEKNAGIMGLHHSEGRTGEFFGRADIDNNPAKVVELNDGEFGLYVVTKLNNEPGAKRIIDGYNSGNLHSFSITFDSTVDESAMDFSWHNDELVKVLQPSTRLFGYTAASNPVNENAVAISHGYREFREFFPKVTTPTSSTDGAAIAPPLESREEKLSEATPMVEETVEVREKKPCKADEQAAPQMDIREMLDKHSERIISEVSKKLDVREKVLTQEEKKPVASKEMREFVEILEGKSIDIREQFSRAARVADVNGLWDKGTSRAETREYSKFSTNDRKLEYRGLGVTTNQNSDTDYLQSAAELQDVYDPVIYNALNQATVFWNVLTKENFSGKGNNQVQFTLKTAANVTAAFYSGNSVATGAVTRLKFQSKFKKIQVGVSVDGDMIAAARGGPVSDVFAQEVMDSTMDMLSVLNAALFAEVGLETASAVIGLEYLADSAGNTTLYNLTRSTANRLAPDAAGNTYINGASAPISMANLRAAIRNAVVEGASRSNLLFVTHPIQADFLRAKFDDARRMLSPKDTGFGFETDLFIDGVPVFEDKDCTSDNWHLVDRETHKVAIWVPPTIEKLGKVGDSEDAFIKMYLAVYNRAPRRVAMIYDNAIA